MRRTVRRMAALLAVFIMAALAGCIHIQKIDPVNEPQTPDPVTSVDNGTSDGGNTLSGTDNGTAGDAAIPVNFTLDQLFDANSISTLLEWNDTVTVRRSYDGGESTECFWKMDGDRVCVSEYKTGDDVSVGGSFRGFDFYVYPDDWTTASKWVTREAEDFDGWIDNSINSYFPSALTEDIVITEEDDNNYTVRLVEELGFEDGHTTPCVNTAVINKGTLFVQSFAWEYYDGDTRYYGGFEVEYDGGRIYSDILEDWEGTRTVTIDILTEGGERTEEFQFPELWQLRCLPDEGIYLRSADAIEEDGTVLIEANSGNVTVLARDAANLPASGADGGEGTAIEGLPFTLEELTERNRITNLTKKYGTVILTTYGEGSMQTTSFFRRGNGIAHADVVSGEIEGEVISYASGQFDDFRFEVDFEGNGTLYAEFPESDDTDEYLFVDRNADGEHYANDLYLTEVLQFGAFGTIGDAKETPDGYTFRFQYDYEGGEEDYVEYKVDKETLLIDEILYGLDGSSVQVERGGEVEFAGILDDAFAETRDIFVHYENAGEVQYEVPALWAFTVGYFDEYGFFADEGMKTPIDPVIPGDGENYEFWVTRGVG